MRPGDLRVTGALAGPLRFTLVTPKTSKRRVPLVPVLVAAAAVLVMCAGAAVFVVKELSWDTLLGRPSARVTDCVVEEHKTPFPTEAGFAQATIEVNNPSQQDQIYVVGVVVKTAGGEVVGTVEHRIGVPALHYRWDTWRVILTKPGGRDCEVAKVQESA